MPIFHPAVLILLWLAFAVVLQLAPPLMLLPGGLVLSLLALYADAGRLFRMLRRTRWIFLTLLTIYLFATPGEPLFDSFDGMTREGLHDGALQLVRLYGALAALTLLLGWLARPALIAGMYLLARPLGLLGIARERLVVRLALTLDYAEQALLEKRSNWRDSLSGLMDVDSSGETGEIELPDVPLRVRDGILLLAVLPLMMVMLP